MARSDAVWGIDVGQCSLKALRCRPDDDPDQINADAFDYIEYPKILSQPGADPEELVAEALKQFLSRNTLRGDRVAISVSGQSGLARFIKLPPVEAKKISDIVRYEAKQQIPFDLDDVIWDYQRMGGGSEEEGFALETEIGLFAMKRDQVFRALEPFHAAGIQVDFVQLTPLALYNYVAFDRLTDLPPPDEYDPDNPPPSVIILSLGTDATDLVVTNGYRVWQRSIPIGGNHFTRALTKELKLTFAKAEHLKRNANSAGNRKAVFQAMRPVFNDLLTEVQRSIGYFNSLDRAAKIDHIVTLGNAMKLPLLRRYLSESLGFEIVRMDSFRGITGPEVLGAPAFKDNLLSFGVCYGLALQGLGISALKTNLLPREIVKDRLIKEKKPWAVAAAAVVLLSCGISFASYYRSLGTVDDNLFKKAEGVASTVIDKAKRCNQEAEEAWTQFDTTDEIGKHLLGNVENRILWPELLKAVNACLPTEDGEETPESIDDRNEVHITSMECQWVPNLEAWFAVIQQKNLFHLPPNVQMASAGATEPNAAANAARTPAAGATPAARTPAAATPAARTPAGATPGANPATGQTAATGAAAGKTGDAGEKGPAFGPSGPGWIIQLTGHHFHNRKVAGGEQGAEYVRNTLITNFYTKKAALPASLHDPENVEMVPIADLGIGYPVLFSLGRVHADEVIDPNVDAGEGVGTGMGGGMPSEMDEGRGAGPGGAMGGRPSSHAQKRLRGDKSGRSNIVPVRRFDFAVQFCWQPAPPSKRAEMKKAKMETEAEADTMASAEP